MPSSSALVLFIIGIATLALGLVTTFLTRAVARRVGFVAKPRPDRWHAKPTALAGGVGIFLAFMPTLLYAGGPMRWKLAAGASAMFVLGFVDDIFHLKPYAKLIGQLAVAGATVALGMVLPWTPWLLANQAISLFWIIGITNALNLLDNMDGLATGVAGTGAVFQAIFFALQGQGTEAVICAGLAGALLGFLAFNWNPASIFMGDCGSLFLGYTLSVLAMSHNYGRARGLVIVIAAPVLIMLVPIFDTTFVTITRVLRGRPVSQGGRDHTSHRLVTLGMSERMAVSTLIGVGVLGGLIGVSARLGFSTGVWVGVPLLAIALAFLAIHLARTDKPDTAPDSHRIGLLSWVSAFAYKRRIFEVLLDAVLAMVALVAAFLLRFDGEVPADTLRDLTRVFPVLIAIKVVVLYFSGAYDGVWQFVGVRDMLRLVRGCVFAAIASIVVAGVWLRFGTLSRGALVTEGILFTTLVAASRVSFRVLRMVLGRQPHADGTRLLLWGAGEAGASLVRKLLDAPEENLVPVGFVDDDPAMLGRKVHGLAVLGSSGDVTRLLKDGFADQVLVTSSRIPADRVAAVALDAGPGKMRRVRLVLEEVNVSSLPPPSTRALPGAEA